MAEESAATTRKKIRIPGVESISNLRANTAAEDNNTPLIASTPQEDIANEPKSTNYVKGNKLPSSFEAMKRTGFKFTSFESSVSGE